MLLGILLIHTAMMVAGSQLSTKTFDLPSEANSNPSSGEHRAEGKPVQPIRMRLEGELRQSSLASFFWNSGFASTQARDGLVALPQTEELRNGNISGTVTDENGDLIPGAVVVLDTDTPADRRTVVADQNGFFEFHNLPSDDSYHVIVTATGFTSWKSQVLHLGSGQFLILDHVALKVDGGPISVTVTASAVEIATEEVRIAEHQRVLGFIPNFLVVYDRNPAPLTAKLKFKLALRVAVDPVTFVGVAGFAAINQGANTPNFVQGLKGYGQRAGALYADGFTDLMLGGALLPSLLHQDPRYFYQGKGTTKSRLLHALLSPFWCRGDNGKWQPNYSSLGGNLASTAISEAYYPASNRGPGLVFGNFAIGTGERMVSGLAQEFLLRKLTPGAAKNSNH